MAGWNPWHGCHKYSDGCKHCYVYRMDEMYGRDSSVISKTKAFNLPIQKNRAGEYKLKEDGYVYTCFSSDFFLEDADPWRAEAWDMIRRRQDLNFFIITKRIERLHVELPSDWGDGYKNVTICCTVENQDRADFRLPIYNEAPIRHKSIICSPLLERIDLSKYLNPSIEQLVVGGESGLEARVCDYDWVLDLRNQAERAGIPFHFQQTGARLKKDGRVFFIPRKYQHEQARKANIDIPIK